MLFAPWRLCVRIRYRALARKLLIKLERWDLEGLTARDRAAPSFATVSCHGRPTSRGSTHPTSSHATTSPCPSPRLTGSPLNHLGHQVVELTSAVSGHTVPVLKSVGEAVCHLAGHH